MGRNRGYQVVAEGRRSHRNKHWLPNFVQYLKMFVGLGAGPTRDLCGAARLGLDFWKSFASLIRMHSAIITFRFFGLVIFIANFRS